MAASEAPYTGTPAMVPHRDSRAQAMVHYGVFIPRLPEPYRYLNTMTLIGASGTEIFDNDALAAPDARDTTTVFSSTAHADQTFYRSYDAAADCEFAADGSHLAWGEDLTIDVADGTAHIVGSYETFDVDITSTITDQVSYFVRTPIYDHLSLLAPFTGAITDGDGVHEVSGLGTFEYAHAMTPQALCARPLPARFKLPADFFTYQVIELDERTQLLLTCVSARGRIMCLTVHLRVLGETARVFDDVSFEVLDYADRPCVDRWGRQMRVPARFRWIARDGGATIVDLEAVPDSTWRPGHGRGYAGAYRYRGRAFGDDAADTGYIEWVDVQNAPRHRWSGR
nr:DUF6670 family protein [Gordonia humi]